MAVIYTTRSGSKHYVNYFEKTYKRLQEGDSALSVSLRSDGEMLTFTDANTPAVGENLVVVLEPLGDGEATFRMSTPVVTVEVV